MFKPKSQVAIGFLRNTGTDPREAIGSLRPSVNFKYVDEKISTLKEFSGSAHVSTCHIHLPFCEVQ